MSTKIITLAILSPLLLFAGCSNKDNSISENYNRTIFVAKQELRVEVVDTDNAREIGLSGRTHLNNENGMLFDFTNTNISKPSFWMKDMKFDIDIIWIYNNSIVEIEPYVPATYGSINLPTYSPSTDITHVLEVPAGWVDKYKIKVGDRITM